MNSFVVDFIVSGRAREGKEGRLAGEGGEGERRNERESPVKDHRTYHAIPFLPRLTTEPLQPFFQTFHHLLLSEWKL